MAVHTPTLEPSLTARTGARTEVQATADLVLILILAAADLERRISAVVRALLAAVQVPMGTAEILRVRVVRSDASRMGSRMLDRAAMLRMVGRLVGMWLVAFDL